MSRQVATTILEQLGGNKFIAMTGAKSLTASRDTLTFSLPGGAGFCKDGINRVAITLNASDTYDMKFYRMRKRSALVLVASREGVYNAALREVFEQETGLRTSL